MTASDRNEALRISECLVEERLAACVNILGPIDSIYRWEDKTQRGGEVALIAKTTGDRLEALTARVKALHSYDCPCVVALPIQDGAPDFLKWIATECQADT